MKIKKITAVLLITACLLFTGCEDIRYGDEIAPVDSSSGEAGESGRAAREYVPDKYKQKKYDLTKKDFFKEIEAESPYELDADSENTSFSVEVDVTAPQHYRIGIRVSAASAVISLSDGEQTVGAYYVERTDGFRSYYLDHIYLPMGKTKLTFTLLRGAARVSGISLENAEPVSEVRYKAIPKLSVMTPSKAAAATYDYLVSVFGSKTLAAQYCTVNTNTELEAAKSAAGRYAAVRCGDLANYSRSYAGDKSVNREIELAVDWNKNSGGIVFFTWSWYAPDGGGYLSEDTAFNLSDAVAGIDVSRMDIEQISELAEKGDIPYGTAALIRDIDDMAANLGVLAKEDVPVLWQPMPDAGSRLYWWGDSLDRSAGESYVWLWRLMFDRMSYYHALDNLIWVWNGGGYEYYPGDACVDIIAESVYNKSVYGSEVTLFGYTSEYGNARKPAALTGSGGLPSPDVFRRDNTRWLFWALYRGDFIVDGYGNVNQDIAAALDKFYNHEAVVTLDELPDVNRFGT